MKKKIVYIAHPIGAPGIEARTLNIQAVLNLIDKIGKAEPGVVPFAPYIPYVLALQDNVPEDRARGMNYNTEIIASGVIKELRLYGPKVSNGMKKEMYQALRLGIPVFDYTTDFDYSTNWGEQIPEAAWACSLCDWTGNEAKPDYQNTCSVCPECNTREVYELNPVFESKLITVQAKQQGITTYKLSDKGNRGIYCTIALETYEGQPTAGKVTVTGEYGDFSNYWGAMGNDGLHSFLQSLNIGYFAGKVGKSRWFNIPDTLQAMNVYLQGLWKDKSIADEDFYSASRDLKEFETETENFISEDAFYSVLYGGNYKNLTKHWYDGVPDLVTEIDPLFSRFWSEMWEPFMDYLKFIDNAKNGGN